MQSETDANQSFLAKPWIGPFKIPFQKLSKRRRHPQWGHFKSKINVYIPNNWYRRGNRFGACCSRIMFMDTTYAIAKLIIDRRRRCHDNQLICRKWMWVPICECFVKGAATSKTSVADRWFSGGWSWTDREWTYRCVSEQLWWVEIAEMYGSNIERRRDVVAFGQVPPRW